MASITVTYWGLTGTKSTVTVDDADSIDDLIAAVAIDEGLPTDYYQLSKNTDPSNTLSSIVGDSTAQPTLNDLGIGDGDTVFCTTAQDNLTKQERQVQKLEIAQVKRKGGPSADTTAVYYRSNNEYDLTALPDTYNDNFPGADDNPNADGLLPKRPWVTAVALAAPATLTEAVIGGGGTLTDLQIWYDASDTGTIVPNANDEQTVNQWQDKSAFAHNANSTGGTKPSYENTSLQKGYGYIEFNGGEYFDINPFTQLDNADNFTVFVVAKRAATANVETLVASDENDLEIKFNGTTVEVTTGGLTGSKSGITSTNWSVHTVIWNKTAGSDAARLIYRVNKTAWSSPTYSGTAVSMSTDNDRYVIGANYDGSTVSNEFTGFVGEIILFSRTLGSTEYANVENYLTSKWI